MRKSILAAALVAALGSAGVARAWEATTTNAGLTEAAALGSKLHARLQDWGLELGLYAPLTVPRASAPTLFQRLALLEPSEGYVPDARGRQSALAWLIAGAVIEEVPGARGRNHFFDPQAKPGARPTTPGVPAPDWIVAKENDLGLSRFLDEQEAAIAAATPAEREQHLAYALLTAGAMSATLEDVGSPSRVRGDLAEHRSSLGGGPGDRGSRFEHLAAIAFGRVGVALVDAPVVRTTLRGFFTASDGTGLADVTSARWYSSGTLPGPLLVAKAPKAGELPRRVAQAQRFASPAPTGELDLTGAAEGGARLRDKSGVCLADYSLDESHLTWSISDECAAEQLAVILPDVAAYAAGFLDFLFRGTLVVSDGGSIAVGDVALGEGTLRVFAEDASGKRTGVGNAIAVKGGAAGATLLGVPTVPGKRVVAVFRGKDAAGEAIVAAGRQASQAP